MPIKPPHHEMLVITRLHDGREVQKIKVPRLAEPALELFIDHPGILAAVSEGRMKVSWEVESSNLVEEIGTWIITHPDQLSPEIRDAMKRDMELPEWLGI